jgi:hypothetical protein
MLKIEDPMMQIRRIQRLTLMQKLKIEDADGGAGLHLSENSSSLGLLTHEAPDLNTAWTCGRGHATARHRETFGVRQNRQLQCTREMEALWR